MSLITIKDVSCFKERNVVKKEKFHGMLIVKDYDLLSVKGKLVLEKLSSGQVVCREYDENGVAEDNPFKVNIYEAFFKNPKATESNITGSIKRQIGKNSILISESVVREIKQLVSDNDNN